MLPPQAIRVTATMPTRPIIELIATIVAAKASAQFALTVRPVITLNHIKAVIIVKIIAIVKTPSSQGTD